MKQKTALEILKLGKNVFITGSAGTGKTYLLKQYIEYLKDIGVHPTIVAPTGIAASHLKGQTIHSFFALGLRERVDNRYIDSLLKNKYIRKRFSKLKVLIIDEVSMVSPEIFSSMDRILSAFKRSHEPFGGVQVIISGDFFQLAPVSREFKEKRFAWQSISWKELDLKSCYLEEKFRQDDNRLIKILDDIRSGYISEETHNLLNSCFRKELDSRFNPTKLYTHNFDVDRINIEELSKITKKEHIYNYISKGAEKNIDKIFKTALVMKQLILKRGAVVIFIKNNPDKNYINGTTGVVIDFNKHIPIVKTSDGHRIEVLSEDWIVENEDGENIATVTQLPLRLAWAITIHKSQGMTLDSAEIDLSKTFIVGQGYVALSRLKSLDGLRLMGVNDMALSVDPLALKIDKHIKDASNRAVKEFESYSKKEIKKAKSDYISFISCSSLYDENEIIDSSKNNVEYVRKKIREIEIVYDKKPVITTKTLHELERKENKKSATKKGEKKKKVYSHVETKALIERFDSIEDLAEYRGLKESTIITHFTKIRKDDKSIDLNKFKPHPNFIEAIEEAVLELKKLNSKYDFDEDGSVKKYSVVCHLNKRYSYQDVELALLFIE